MAAMEMEMEIEITKCYRDLRSILGIEFEIDRSRSRSRYFDIFLPIAYT